MDLNYKEAADFYEFECKGCKDNCCFTRFFHHTNIECIYLLEGYSSLDPLKQQEILKKAEVVCQKSVAADKKEEPIKLLCPLNTDGMCLLYDHRPMICRMHGISHQLKKPGGQPVYGPGCDLFTEQTKDKNHFTFDRTPFYFEMAGLENDLKKRFNINRKFKKTIAQMIAEAGLP